MFADGGEDGPHREELERTLQVPWWLGVFCA
jgi:hypothetical protein